MTGFRLAIVALLVTISGSARAVDAPSDPEKLRVEFAKLSAENEELKKKVQELMLSKAKCQHIIDQIARGAKDD